MTEITITPIGKPRMTQRDKWKGRPVVNSYYAFKDELTIKCRQKKFQLSEVLNVVFVIPMPQSWSKKKKAQFNGMPHTSRPDLDNLIKAVQDCLAKEDSYIHTYKDCRKIWGHEGKIIFDSNNRITNE